MKADTSRTTFDPRNHYQGVYLQQGRVQLDADWNEQVALTTHRQRRLARDLVGPVGVRRDEGGFRCTPTADGTDIVIGPGRIHVQGQICENEVPVTLATQPHWPEGAPLVLTEQTALPLDQIPDGRYLIQLDVWTRPVTALEDPALLEPALGGPDTTFRTQLVWQAHLVAVASSFKCGSALPAWLQTHRASTGTLLAATQSGQDAVDDCELSPTGGYQRLENQHYRVEIHGLGPDGTATFKWSRENGSVVVPWQERNGRQLTMGSAAGDLQRRFASGDTIELISDTHLLQGIPGVILTVEGVADDVLTIAEGSAQIPNRDQFGPHPRIRRWEGGPPQKVATGSPLSLEAGIQVTFSAGHYRSGDYWNLPARTRGAGLLWPQDAGGESMAQLPAGIAHAYAPLAFVQASGGALRMAEDCRPSFPPLTDIRAIDVGFDNGSCGNDMRQADSVQEAIEVLCQRPVGGGGTQASGCEIRIDPREGIPLEERIKTQLNAGHQHLCLCLAPGEHFMGSPLVLSTRDTDLHTLHLRGCGPGSKLTLKKPLELELEELRLEGLHLDTTHDASAILLRGDGNIRLLDNRFTGNFENQVPLIHISATGDIRLIGNRLQPSSPAGLQKLQDLFPQSVFDLTFKPEAFSSARHFRRTIAPAAAKIAHEPLDQRRKLVGKWQGILIEKGIDSKELSAQLEGIRNTLSVNKIFTAELTRQLMALRSIGLADLPTVALALTDEEARVHLVDNLFDGDLLLYGPTPGSLGGTVVWGLLDMVQKNVLDFVTFSEGQGHLDARGNRFTRVGLASELTDEITRLVEEGKPGTPFNLFHRMAWSDNQFSTHGNTMAAEVASFSSNHFESHETGVTMATSIAAQASFTGNIGPQREVAVSTASTTFDLYDISRSAVVGSGRAGNLLRFYP